MNVAVAIVNLNGSAMLDQVLGDLGSHTIDGYTLDTIVVDNASTDNSVELVETKYPDVNLLRMDRNTGFAPAVNVAARATDADFIALLNNDCRLRDGWLDSLVATITKSPEIACVGSLILDRAGENIDFHRASMNLFGFGFHVDKGEPASTALSEPFPSIFACGAAFIFNRDIFLLMGGMCDEMFAFFEDVEIGWRLNASGYKVLIDPGSVVEHHHGATVSRFGKGFHTFLTERNALANLYCNLSAGESEKILPIAMALAAVRYEVKTGSNPDEVLGQEGYEALFPDLKVAGSGLKDKLKKLGSRGDGSSRAILEALADFGRMIPLLHGRKKMLESYRKVSTGDLLELMGEPFRSVIGHEREKTMIAEGEKWITENLDKGSG